MRFVGVLADRGAEARDEDVERVLGQLGAAVRVLDLWADPRDFFEETKDDARCVVVDAGARPDVGGLVLRRVRAEPLLREVGALLVVAHEQVGRFEPAMGYDDFVLSPVVPAELYARLRAVEWRRSEFTNEERIKLGEIVIDRPAREVTCSGEVASLTAREFDLLVYLADHRGKVVSRSELLSRVWGPAYEGGERTIDIHVRRLRAKLGHELTLETFRGAGYRLGAPR
jgi:DNA-binding response OmpR family regulator